ncbi:hypothetical protein GCM10010972_00280 [Cellulomonas carbonis]|nr:hypothetical protein GCM10010972_00280 [Cellulomonas carbonis]
MEVGLRIVVDHTASIAPATVTDQPDVPLTDRVVACCPPIDRARASAVTGRLRHVRALSFQGDHSVLEVLEIYELQSGGCAG